MEVPNINDVRNINKTQLQNPSQTTQVSKPQESKSDSVEISPYFEEANLMLKVIQLLPNINSSNPVDKIMLLLVIVKFINFYNMDIEDTDNIYT